MQPDGIDFVGNSKISSFCENWPYSSLWYLNTLSGPPPPRGRPASASPDFAGSIQTTGGAAIGVAACVEIAGPQLRTAASLPAFEGMLSLFNPALHCTPSLPSPIAGEGREGGDGAIESGLVTGCIQRFRPRSIRLFAILPLSIRRLALLQ